MGAAAYLLAQLGGNDAPDADAIKAILGSVGVDADEEKLGKVISELSGKDINEVLAEGQGKLASVPSGGGAAAPAAGGAAGGAAEEAKKPRRNPHPRAKTKIWDSVFSIKTEDDSYRHLFATVRHLFVLHVS